MNANDVVKLSLENSRGWAMGLLMDMKDQPMIQATSAGGNHPMWILGHVDTGSHRSFRKQSFGYVHSR